MPKLATEYGVLMALEAAYADGAVPVPATHGQDTVEPAEVALEYAHDGARGNAPGGAPRRRVAPSGLFGSSALEYEAAGAGAAYAAAVHANVHNALRIAGYAVTTVTTVGSETDTYAPENPAGGFASGSLFSYDGEELKKLKGVLADLEISMDGAGVPRWAFSVQGQGNGMPTEAAVPAGITLPTVLPPDGDSVTVHIGSFEAAVVREFGFSLNRPISPRGNINAGGHKGFNPGNPSPELELLIEADAFVADPFVGAGGIDPYSVFDTGGSVALALAIGSVQYERWKLNAPQAQISGPIAVEKDESTVLWRIPFILPASTPGGYDTHTIVFD